jgi:hypothetical protein
MPQEILNHSNKEKIVLNKLASLTLAAALLTALCGTSVFANSSSSVNSNKDQPVTRLRFVRSDTNKSRINERLRVNVLKLVADAKAGKISSAERPQIQPAKSNNLSRRTKIAIGVGIAAAVVTIVLIIRKPRLTGLVF